MESKVVLSNNFRLNIIKLSKINILYSEHKPYRSSFNEVQSCD